MTAKIREVLRKLRLDLSRKLIARFYLSGNGIEIGGLNNPLPLSRKASVRYVDRMSVEDLRKQYPELSGMPLVHVDVIDNGELLSTVDDDSQDFVIANHFLEHTENPILAVQNMLRVLKPGGVLYVALPDKRFTFDSKRPVTKLDHIVTDFKNGPAWSVKSHYEEWARIFNEHITDDAEIVAQAESLMSMNYSIHYHVWTPKEMLELFLYISNECQLKFEYELMFKNDVEVIFLFRKSTDNNGVH
ncbi:MAG TPA: methyltransferase domain-containing protein [Geobacteraceae bacterium]|nr:methyltransferase domain-containing protein [Geobacteraceae bacterium]